MSLGLFYYDGANFGDAMSPLIVEKLSGCKTHCADFATADMMAVGSVFYRGDYLIGSWEQKKGFKAVKAGLEIINGKWRRPIDVWGSGFLQYPDFPKPFFRRRLRICALRGRCTQRILASFGLVSAHDDIPLGDPGLLFADLFGIRPNPEYDIGVIPHVNDVAYGLSIADDYAKKGMRVSLIDASGSPRLVVEKIAKCERIASSSLHGLIVADSLGIPNQHLVFSTLGHDADNFWLKFKDYYSAFDEELPSVDEFSVRDHDKIEDVKKCLGTSFRQMLEKRD